MLSCFSRVWLLVTLGTIACQAPLSMGVSRQEHWSGLPCPPPGHFPNPGIEPGSLMSPALAGGFFTTSATWKATYIYYTYIMHITICVRRIYIYTFFLEYSLPFWFITRYSSLSITVSCCFCSVTESCPNPCDPPGCSAPGFPGLHCLPEFAQTHVHELVVLFNQIILCHPFSFCPQSFPASGSFLRSQLFTSDGQNIGASASVLSMNIQHWFPLGWTGLISLQSKGLLRVFSNTTDQKHQFCTQLLQKAIALTIQIGSLSAK